MFLDQLKTVSVRRAASLIGVDKHTIAKAIEAYRLTNGARGMAFIIPSGAKRPRIRLCAISDWLKQQEDVSRYA